MQALLAAARAAQANAYAPYSRYKVGAALATPDGRVFAGCNVENAAYPSGTCAEAGAIAAMAAAGGREIAELLVVGEGPELVTPCGNRRQRIREFAGPATRVHAAGAVGVVRSFSLDELLPHAFGPEHLPAPGQESARQTSGPACGLQGGAGQAPDEAQAGRLRS